MWFARVEQVQPDRASRQALCDEIGDEADAFIGKWLDFAKTAAPAPLGTEDFQNYWKKKNGELGKNRRLAK